MRFINIHEEYIDIYLSLIKHLYLGWSFVGEQDIHKIVGRNINNLIYADDTTLMAEGEKEIKSLLMK